MKLQNVLILSILIIGAALTGCQASTEAKIVADGKAKDVSVEEARTATSEQDVQFLDVRTEGEYASGFPAKALNFPLDSLEEDIAKLDRLKPTYIICETGRRSVIAMGTLEKAGFTKLFNVAGGMTDWRKAKFPIEKPGVKKQSSTLDEKTEKALLVALNDERRAEATYQAIMKKHGEVRPFVNIIEAEKRHQSMLLPLFEKYDVVVPKNEYDVNQIIVPETLTESCKAGLEAEKGNIAMYDVFFEYVKEDDIRDVFSSLQKASVQNHSSAFQRCGENKGIERGKGRPY